MLCNIICCLILIHHAYVRLKSMRRKRIRFEFFDIYVSFKVVVTYKHILKRHMTYYVYQRNFMMWYQKCNTWPHHHIEFFQWRYGRNTSAEEYSALGRSSWKRSCVDIVHNRWATVQLSRPLGARPRRPNRSDQGGKNWSKPNTAHSIKTRRNHAYNCPTNHHRH